MSCRICKSNNIKDILNFGDQPIVHHLIKSNQQSFEKFNLILSYCIDCNFTFLKKPIPAEKFYTNYFTLSSWKDQSHAKRIIEIIELDNSIDINSQILEIGSNDGHFIENLKKHGFNKITCIEPSNDAYLVSKSKGHRVINDFFSSKILNNKNFKEKQYDLIISRHVLEHIENLNDFIDTIGKILKNDGTIIFEIPDFDSYLEYNDFTLWEEHVNCFNLHSINNLMRINGFSIYHHEKTLFSGRALTIFAKKNFQKLGPLKIDFYNSLMSNYANNFFYLKKELHSYLSKFEKIAVYGCGSRSSLFVNLFELNMVEFFIDDQLEKQNHILPGLNVSIKDWDDKYKSYFFLLGVMYENEKKVIKKRNLENKNYFSILPPSSNLPKFWRMINDK